jgi:hypothetical protein
MVRGQMLQPSEVSQALVGDPGLVSDPGQYLHQALLELSRRRLHIDRWIP